MGEFAKCKKCLCEHPRGNDCSIWGLNQNVVILLDQLEKAKEHIEDLILCADQTHVEIGEARAFLKSFKTINPATE